MPAAPARTPRTEVVKARVSPVTKAEVQRWAAREDRTEGDMLRVLVNEALTERARTRR